MKTYSLTDTHILTVRTNRKDSTQSTFAHVYVKGQDAPVYGAPFSPKTPLGDIKYWAKKQINGQKTNKRTSLLCY